MTITALSSVATHLPCNYVLTIDPRYAHLAETESTSIGCAGLSQLASAFVETFFMVLACVMIAEVCKIRGLLSRKIRPFVFGFPCRRQKMQPFPSCRRVFKKR